MGPVPKASRLRTWKSGCCCSLLLRAEPAFSPCEPSGAEAGRLSRLRKRPMAPCCGSGDSVLPEPPCSTSSAPSEFGSFSSAAVAGSPPLAATRLSQLRAAGLSCAPSPPEAGRSCSAEGRAEADRASVAAPLAAVVPTSLTVSAVDRAASSAVFRKRKMEARPDFVGAASPSAVSTCLEYKRRSE